MKTKDYDLYYESFSEDFLLKHKTTFIPEKRRFHIHDVFEILFIRSENVICNIDEKSYHIPANTVILFNNTDLHLITLNKRCKYDRYVLFFKPEYIEQLSSPTTNLLECFFFRPFLDSQILKLSIEAADQIEVMLNKIIDSSNKEKKDTYGKDLYNKFLIGELLIYINRLYREYHNIVPESILPEYKRIYSLIAHIHTNLETDLCLDNLAKYACTNKHSLCELFKKVTGFSPNQYVINCRIMKAKELLVNNMPVDTVCALVGYNTLSHFIRIFKQHTKLSPKQYGKQNTFAED
ncbi:helix-turn-helix transcriptional regulator [Treponema sp. OMZ 840]|uniref:AraC family transcriptional regulator n=1 Tax=Treponema sp. OMZ 840 TaxID=244313 RepID=UPI003D8D1FD1